jgi:hypothetical protein
VIDFLDRNSVTESTVREGTLSWRRIHLLGNSLVSYDKPSVPDILKLGNKTPGGQFDQTGQTVGAPSFCSGRNKSIFSFLMILKPALYWD